MRTAASALAVLTLVSACATPHESRDRPTEARARVAAYLDAVAGGQSDRGWSLLGSDSRRAYDSRDQYIELAAAADWERFSWRSSEADATYCEDGGVYCQVRLQIVGTPPDFLLNAPNWKPTDHLRTIFRDESGGEPVHWMVVYFDPSGSRGISTGGG